MELCHETQFPLQHWTFFSQLYFIFKVGGGGVVIIYYSIDLTSILEISSDLSDMFVDFLNDFSWIFLSAFLTAREAGTTIFHWKPSSSPYYFKSQHFFKLGKGIFVLRTLLPNAISPFLHDFIFAKIIVVLSLAILSPCIKFPSGLYCFENKESLRAYSGE